MLYQSVNKTVFCCNENSTKNNKKLRLELPIDKTRLTEYQKCFKFLG
jgi:hypothetical protein